MNKLEAMKDELVMLREEKICMEAWVTALESVLEEHKRMLSEYKAMVKLADDLLDVVIVVGGDERNHGQNLDEEIIKGLVEEAMRSITEVLNEAQSHRWSLLVNGGNINGGRERSFGNQNLDMPSNPRIDGGKRGGTSSSAHPKSK